MDRLTEYGITMLKDGTKIYDLSKLNGDTCDGECLKHYSCTECPIQEAISKLAAYEDSGLSPAEVMELAKNAKGGQSNE